MQFRSPSYHYLVSCCLLVARVGDKTAGAYVSWVAEISSAFDYSAWEWLALTLKVMFCRQGRPTPKS